MSQLRALIALVGERSVSRAALALGRSQPQMSATLRRLRVLLDDPILVRGRREMVPTDRAQALLAPAQRMVADMQLIAAGREAFDPRTMRGSLRMAIPDYISAALLGAILGAIRSAAPAASTLIAPVRSETDGAHMLESGQADLIIESSVIRSDTLRHAPLFDDTILAVAARHHPQVHKEMTLAQYLSLPHVAASPASGARPGIVDRMLAERGHSRRVVAWVPYFNTLPPILADSDLVLTTSAHMARQLAAQAELQVFMPPFRWPRIRFSLMWHERAHRSGEGRWLRGLIRAAVDTHFGSQAA